MRIFLSHSSRQKPLIREIKDNLPSHLESWLDEEKLLFGDDIESCISSTIRTDTDYVIFFLDEYAANSEWVRKEIEWTLEAEKECNRVILLTVLIDEGAIEKFGVSQIKSRKYLHLKDFNQHSVHSLAEALMSELFALVSRDLQNLRYPSQETPSTAIANVDSLIQDQATLVHEIVFPHRETNPITREELLSLLNDRQDQSLTDDDLDIIISSIIQRNLIAGLVYDGYEAYIVEEHASWKSRIQHEKKEKVGRKAASFIKNGMTVFLDAGSTTEEVVNVLCKKIKSKALANAVFGTTSIKIAAMISDCCVEMGFDDDSTAIRLYVPGGRVRLNTQAIIPALQEERRQISALANHLGGFDVGIIGVNGVEKDQGFTTHENAESINKADIIANSSQKLIVGDSSKVGIVLENSFATFVDDILLIIDHDQSNHRLAEILDDHNDKVVLC